MPGNTTEMKYSDHNQTFREMMQIDYGNKGRCM